jgi:hypothetical protein
LDSLCPPLRKNRGGLPACDDAKKSSLPRLRV